MSRTDDIRLRPGKIRSTRAPKAKSFMAQALRASQKAGGLGAGAGRRNRTFGRGRSASLAAARLLGARSRGAVIKARVVRQRAAPGALGAHVRYLQRDGVTQDGQPGRLFDAKGDEADGRAFAERCEGDRHHFRFIVSPDDAAELADLKAFTRELMAEASHDLGSKLDWVAVDHWNTEHPHIHILVRGRSDDGQDLVISRDYISQGLRARAAALVTQELGPRTELDVRRGLEAEMTAERFTRLDRVLVREAASQDGVIDLRPGAAGAGDAFRELRIGRARTLERLGLAEAAGPGRWVIAEDAEQRLRALGERGDIIKRLHRGLTAAGVERAPQTWSLEGEARSEPVIGKLIARGLDDELRGSAFAIVDGVDGRVHHLRLPDLEAASDGPLGGVVELRRFEDRSGRDRVALAVRSDLSVEAQVTAHGATWIDRQLVAREPAQLARTGFGLEVRSAMEQRVDRLVEQGLARKEGDRVVFPAGMLETLRRRELADVAKRVADETGLTHLPAEPGDAISGVYRRRLSLASGRFAMIDNGLGFQLVPWSPSMERNLGRQVSGAAGVGRLDWDDRRKRDLSL